MSKQSENFKKLVKGNPIGSITTAIKLYYPKSLEK